MGGVWFLISKGTFGLGFFFKNVFGDKIFDLILRLVF
jgi:hypothetical protein